MTTNQFEIEERLNGLEEKFQVLNQAELSDALHQRRSDLLQHQHRWIPDALDLLLKLSHQPLKYAQAARLDVPKEQNAVPVSLKWSDIDAEDPVDRRGKIWRLPDFTDFSSDEDEALPSSADTSPEKGNETHSLKRACAVPGSPLQAIQSVPDSGLISDFHSALFWTHEGEVTVTEGQVRREVLFMVQGYPTSIFGRLDGQVHPNQRFKLTNLSSRSLGSMMLSAVEIAKAAQLVRKWSTPYQKLPFMQILDDSIKRIWRNFYDTVTGLQAQHFRIAKEGGVISLLSTIEQLRQASPALQAAQNFITNVMDQDAIGHLDVLFDHVCRLQCLGDSEGYSALMQVLLQALKSHARQIDHWIQWGTIVDPASCFFVHRVTDEIDKARFWQSWYTYTASGPNRLPEVFRLFAKRIFICGKTIAFAKMLGFCPDLSGNSQTLSSIIDAATPTSSSSLRPFAATLSDSLTQYVSNSLHLATTSLQATLQQKCTLTSTLHAISELYLSASPPATDTIGARLFSHLDLCQNNWNDRFLISDLISEVHADSDLDIGRVTVHSEPTPASTLATARRSVDVLANIAFDYRLPWPIANILLSETQASYRRVSLLLMQIRRAKYVLERRAYLRLRLQSASQSQPAIPRRATELYIALLNLTTTLYAHFTSCVISPLTHQLDTAISSSAWTVDDLISLHGTYLRNLEFSCLTSKTLKVLKDTVIGLLDICVEFGFTLSDISSRKLNDSNTRSELEDKLQRMSAHFGKQLDFLVAGLRGVARSSAATTTSSGSGGTSMAPQTTGDELAADQVGRWRRSGETMELLADSLESALMSRRR